MDENNDNVNRLDTVLGVEEDKSVGTKISSFVKKLGNIPDNKDVDINMRTLANFGDLDKEVDKASKRWNRMSKKQVGNSFLNYMFGDKRRVKSTKRIFTELETIAKKSIMRYNNRLNELQGPDRIQREKEGKPWGGEWATQSLAMSNNSNAIIELEDRLAALKQERNDLLSEQRNAKLLPNEEKTLQAIDDMIIKIAELEKKRDAMIANGTKGVIGKSMLEESKQKVLDWNLELSKLAAGLFHKTGRTVLFDRLKQDIDEDSANSKDSFMTVAKQLRSTNTEKRAANKKVDIARAEYEVNPTVETERNVENAEAELNALQNKVDRLSSQLELAKQKVILNRERKAQYDEHYANRYGPQDFDSYKVKTFIPKFDDSMRKKNTKTLDFTKTMKNVSTTKQIQDLGNVIKSYKKKEDMLRVSLKHLTADKTMENINRRLSAKNEEIDKTNAKLKETKQEGNKLAKTFDKIEREIADCNEQLDLLQADMNFNPFKFKMMSKDLQGVNNAVLETKANTKKWYQILKKSNVITRIIRRVMINIRSQIADMINPLTLFRRGWDAWLNRFDNLPWKNTFDVIAYNMVTAFSSVFEWLAKALIKIAQVLNVFTKRFAGVDLFDKSAWQLEQMKKGVGQLTASFDELHSNNDNPNQFNTIFDTDPLAITPLSEETEAMLNKIADKLANFFGWLKEHWKGVLIGAGLLWGALQLGKIFGGFSLIGSLIKGIGKVIGKVFGTLWTKIFKPLFAKIGTWLAGLWPKITAGISSVVAKMGGWLKSLSLVGGVLATIQSGYETITLGTKWDQMDDKQKDSTMAKSMGWGTIAGGLIGFFVGGPVGAAIGAGIGAAVTGGIDSAIADYNGDDARAELAGAVGGAGLGAAIGTLIAPGIGTAIGAAIGAGIGWGVEKLGHLTFSNGRDYSNLKISTEDLAWANERLAAAQDKARESAYNLKFAEEQTGESGKALYEAVESGRLSYENMSSSQMVVYEAYKQHMAVLNELHKAQQTQMDYETAMDLDRAEKSDNYAGYIDKMIQANKDGIYSNNELQDRFAQVYGELDRTSRQIFLEQLPENMRQGVETAGQEYLSNWSKFYDDCCNNWEEFKTGWSNFWGGVGEAVSTKWEEIKTNAAETWESIKGTASTIWENTKTTVGNIWEGMKTLGGNIWRSIRIEATEEWDEMKTAASTAWENIKSTAGTAWENIKNSAIGQKVQETVENAKIGWENLKTKTGEVWENIKSAAATAWDNVKNSAIGQKVQEIVTNTSLAWETLKTNAVEAWENLKTSAVETWGNIKTTLSDTWENVKTRASETWENIKTTAKDSWENIKTTTVEVWENMKTKAGETWDSIKDKASETWENIKESAIGQKVQEIWKNTTDKFEEIKTKVSDGWNTLKTNAKEKWNSIKESIVNAAKTAWDNAKGFFNKIAEGVKKAWESLKGLASKTGERVGNFFGGKGFKTDEEYNEYVKKYGVPEYAVGTNYVPNDQLAMVHKGEAIIPAKYNKPYTPPSNNSDLENTISAMTQEIANLRGLIQSGIPVKGEFKQRGSDLVAVVEKGRHRNGNSMLSNPAYAR